MDLLVLFTCAVGCIGIIFFLVYRYSTRTFGYWEALGVPTVKPKPLYGNMEDYFQKSIEEVEKERFEKYGRLYGTYEFMQRALNIADPELVQQVLIKDFHIFTNRRTLDVSIPILESLLSTARDKTWKRIRTVVGPSFTSGKLRKMIPVLTDATNEFINNLSATTKSQDLVDLKTYFSSYTMDVIGLCAFGIHIDSLKNPDHPFIVNVKKYFSPKIPKLVALLYFIPWCSKLFDWFLMDYMGLNYFNDICENIIKKRKGANQKVRQTDFMQLMLDARERKLEKDTKELQSEHAYQDKKDNKAKFAWNIEKSLSDIEVLSQSLLFLVAGQETTSTALTFLIYELAMNPNVQQKLFEEVQNHSLFDYDIVEKMTYLDAVVSETLRLHTIDFKLEREASQDYFLGDRKILVPKGALVIVLAYALHHDPEWFPEPYKFDPDRFLPENHKFLKPYTYLPFGDGPRNCIAMRFALLVIKLCLAMILQKFKFVATEETKGPLKYEESTNLLIPRDVKVRVEERT